MAELASEQGESGRTLAVERPQPKYRRLKQCIAEKISTGAWQAGQRVPAEHELMEEHGLSRGTVRRAMDELQFEGLIRRHPGRGTFVADSTSGRAAQKTQWVVLCRYQHGEPGDVTGIESFAREVGAEILVEYVGDSIDRFARAVSRFLEEDVGGMLVEPLPYDVGVVPLCQRIIAARMPMVATRMPVAELDVPVVALNHELVGNQITRHLLDLGHRRIGYVGSPSYWAIERELAGYRAALEAAGVEPEEKWVSLESHFSPERGFGATVKLLRLPRRPTAIIALNDETAANAYRAVRAAGLRIPQDISIAAGSTASRGPHLAAALDPPLTVWCPSNTSYRLGRTAARLLDALIQKTWSPEEKEILIEPAPVPRGSVALAPRED